jgi:hypothetical protein
MSDDTMTVAEEGITFSSAIEYVKGEEDSNLVRHARRELALLGNGPEINDHVTEMVAIFSAAGHSGFSAMYTIGLLERLLRFENLTDLTNNPDEWFHHDYEHSGWKNGIWQNTRNGEAFSFDGGNTYYLVSETQAVAGGVNHIMYASSREKQVAVKHKKYKNKSNHNEVRAIRVTARNCVNVANWVGPKAEAIIKINKDGQESNHRVKVNGLVAQVGDFVVRQLTDAKDDDGKPVYKFFRVKDDVFEAEYAPAV